MAGSGLVDILSCVFRGVDHMLTWKNFAYNFRALKLLAETVTVNTVQEGISCCKQDNHKRLGRWTGKACRSHDDIIALHCLDHLAPR